jgi:hypothetical protein
MDFYSPHRFCTGLEDMKGRLYLTDRVPFFYRDRPDNRLHTVRGGDTLRGLAARYFASLDYAAELWTIVADFQVDKDGDPAPIHDPTIALTPGTTLIIPSVATVLSEAQSEERRLEHDV